RRRPASARSAATSHRSVRSDSRPDRATPQYDVMHGLRLLRFWHDGRLTSTKRHDDRAVMFNDRPGAFWPDAAATRPDHLPTVMPAQRHLAVTRRGPPPSRAFMFFFAVLFRACRGMDAGQIR